MLLKSTKDIVKFLRVFLMSWNYEIKQMLVFFVLCQKLNILCLYDQGEFGAL